MDSEAQVAAVVDAYRQRWLIKAFFKVIKTGCRHQLLQLESLRALHIALAIETAVAWRLLLLRWVAYNCPAPDADTVLSRQHVLLLTALRNAETGHQPGPSHAQGALLELARLGGHIRNNGPPGWLVLRRGFAHRTRHPARAQGHRSVLLGRTESVQVFDHREHPDMDVPGESVIEFVMGIVEDLSDALGERVHTNTRAWETDYGHKELRRPIAVVRPMSTEDVQRTVQISAKHGARITPRGHGCSSDGQTLTESVLLDLTGLTHMSLASETAEFGVGCRTRMMQDFLTERGRTLPIVTDNPDATLGGLLSVGGLSYRSLKRGLLASHVLKAEVVTADGEIRTLSRGSEALSFILCGLGHLGIVTRATIDVEHLVPYTEVIVQPIELSSISAVPLALSRILSDEPAIVGSELAYAFDSSQWVLRMHKEVANKSEGAKEHFYRTYYGRGEMVRIHNTRRFAEQGLCKPTDRLSAVWTDVFVPAPRASKFINVVQGLFNSRELLWLHCVTYLDPRPEDMPLAPLPDADRSISIGVFLFCPVSELASIRTAFDRLADAGLDHGGRVYLYGHRPRSLGFIERQFGVETVARWRELKAQWDPHGRLPSWAFLPGLGTEVK